MNIAALIPSAMIVFLPFNCKALPSQLGGYIGGYKEFEVGNTCWRVFDKQVFTPPFLKFARERLIQCLVEDW